MIILYKGRFDELVSSNYIYRLALPNRFVKSFSQLFLICDGIFFSCASIENMHRL